MATNRFGIYRGIVMNAMDPQRQGRVQVQVPGNASGSIWAMVSRPIGATDQAAAAVGSQVWVMFEGGDPSRPVVTGMV